MAARLRPFLPWLAITVVVVGFVNFLWLIVESGPSGKEAGGLHAATVFVTHPLAMAGMAYLLFTIFLPVMMGVERDPDAAARLARVRTSGAIQASTRTGGRIGGVRLTRPLVRIDVHPGGVVISLFGIAPLAIEASSMRAVQLGRSWGTSTVEIVHRQAGVPPEVFLYLRGDAPESIAMRRLVVTASTPHGSAAPVTASAAAAAPAPEGIAKYPTVMKAWLLIGFGLAIVFALVITVVAPPTHGFGAFGAVLLVAILGFNAWTYFVKNRDRW